MLRGKSRARISRSVQRYFPQCVACCSKQAGAVKSGATRLVFHYYGMRPWYYAGERLCCSCLTFLLPGGDAPSMANVSTTCGIMYF